MQRPRHQVPSGLRWLTAVALAFVTVSAGGAAQEPPSPSRGGAGASAEAPGGPVFASGAELVRLDMVVRTGDGRPVADLRADEVQVFEDGRPCAVSAFRYVSAAPEPAARGGRRLGDAPPRGGPAAAGSSNPAPAAGAALPDSPGSVVVLVFDQLGPEGGPRARAAALEMLKKRFPRDTWFSVHKVGAGLRVLQTTTQDLSLLPPAIEEATIGAERSRDLPRDASRYDDATQEAFALALMASDAGMRAAGPGTPGIPSPTNPIDRMFLAMEAKIARVTDQLTREARGAGSLYPLLAIVRALTTVQGRKTLLYFSEGLDVPPKVEDVFQNAVSTANRANVSVYAFDARGLRVAPPSESTRLAMELDVAQSGGFASEPGGAGGDIDTALDAIRLNRQGVLRDLAESTGGFLVAETNDLRPGLERVAEDLRSFYELAYAPPNPKADGRWRAIQVKVSRPGVTIRTRKGYFALPPGAPVIRPAELPLLAALAQQPLPREVEPRPSVVHLLGPLESLVSVEVPLAPVTLQRDEEAGLWRARLELLGIVKDEKGEPVARLTHQAPLEGRLPDAATAQQGSLVVRRTLRLASGRYTLEAAVQDVESGRVGARRTAFVVPGPAASLALGSVIVVRTEPATDGSAASDGAPAELRVGDVRVRPVLGKPLTAGTRDVSLYLSAVAAAGGAAPELAIEIRREGQTVARSNPALPAPDANGRRALLASVPLPGSPEGRFEVLVRARQGDDEAVEGTSFVIEAPASPAAGAGSGPGAGAPPPTWPTAAVPDRPGSSLAKKPVEAPADVQPVLARAGEYVLAFQEAFRNLVAEENYRQWAGSQVRTLRSELVFVTVPAEMPWATFRDVFEVDGQKVRERDARLEAIFRDTKEASFERANAILKESARHNLGPLYRTVNVPTLALALLRPDNQWRFRWEKRGTRSFDGHDGIELHAVETATPTLVHERSGADLPLEAKLWVEASTGRVLRTQTVFRTRISANLVRPMLSWIDTQYRPEPALGLWVPEEMFERYENVPFVMRDDMERFDGTINGRARYTNFRRFSVQVESTAARAEDGVAPSAIDHALADVLRRAGEYVSRYADTFRNLVVEETYRQWSNEAGHTTARTLRSDLVFAAVPGALPWTTFRDVYEVDGQKVRGREARLEKLFSTPSQANLAAARAIVQESARHNVGTAYRDVNVPTLALLLLLPANQGRFTFVRRGRRIFGGFEGVELAFEEQARPTLVRAPDGADVPSRGRVWIDPSRGSVLRTEVEYDLERQKGMVDPALWERAAIGTEYRGEAGLDVLVPDSMKELYQLRHGRLDCTARYSNYRRFQVSTEWKAAGVGTRVEP